MAPSKRERDYARRRHAGWQQRQGDRARARRQRRRTALAALAVLVVLALVAVLAYVALGTPASSATSSASSSPTRSRVHLTEVPAKSVAQGRTWTGTITTDRGDIGITLDGAKAPQAVASFVTLARKGFFDDTRCHRLVTTGIYVLQCGDPTGTGSGGPGYSFGPIENAPADDVYPAGTIAMARTGGNASSQGSQFFLVYRDSTIPSDSAGGYTVFGAMTSGLSVVTEVAAKGSDDSNGTGDGAPKTPISIDEVDVQ